MLAARLRSGQSDLIIAIMVFGIVLLILLPLAYSTITSYVRTGSSEADILNRIRETRLLQSSVMGEVNATALVRRDGILEIWVTNRGGNEIVIQKIMALLRVNKETLLTDLTRKAVRASLIRIEPSSQLHFAINLSEAVDAGENERISVSSVILVTPEGSILTAKLYTEELLEQLALASVTGGQPISEVHKILGLSVANNDDLSDPALILSKNYDIYSVPPLGPNDVLTRIELNSPARELLNQPDPSKPDPYDGVEGVWYGLVLRDILRDVDISTPSPLAVGNLFLTYYPGTNDKYIIEFSFSRRISNVINIGGTNYDLGGICNYGYRVKIFGYSGNIGLYQVANGTTSIIPRHDPAALLYNYDPWFGRYRYLILNGHADAVHIYCRSSDFKESSYAPYISYVATQPDSKYANLLFTFEDVYFGWASTYNDVIKGRYYYIGYREDDVSDSALVLVYKGDDVIISNTNSTAVSIILNYRFHDNEGNDYYGVTEDRPIMIVGLVDEDGYVLSYRTYKFRELTRYEDTYPPNSEAQSSAIFIPLPPPDIVGEKRYYVFLLVQDPYGSTSRVNDVDFVLYISDLSVLLFGG